MKQIAFAIIFFMKISVTLCQVVDEYSVTAPKLNMRIGPGTTYEVKASLQKNDYVTVIKKETDEWWYVDYNGVKGFVSSGFLVIDPYSGWTKMNYETGSTPENENFVPEVDIRMDNYLKVNVGKSTDVIVKLMKKGTQNDKCIRIVYIREGDSYVIKYIPEGKYYLKLAYGKDYRESVVDGKPYMRFVKNAQYENGDEVLDFYLKKRPNNKVGDKEYENWDVPSFELSLDVVTLKNASNEFSTNNISEVEFNK